MSTTVEGKYGAILKKPVAGYHSRREEYGVFSENLCAPQQTGGVWC